MSTSDRLHALDAVRAFALLLGVVFHAGFSFLPGLIPGLWAMTDNSPSTTLGVLLFVSHIFRMSLFFFVAGFFARMLYLRGGARGFWTNRAKRILVPLVAGWVVIFPLVAAVWIWGLTVTFGGAIPAPPANLPAPPRAAFPLTHLWFLYYLLFLYAAVVVGRAALVALDRRGSLRSAADSALRWLVGTGAAAIVICLPATVALYFHESWIAWFGVPTPDQSLIPQVTSFVAYGTALTFGWLVHRQPAVLTAWGRQWPAHLAGALAASAVCLWMLGPAPALTPAAPGLGKLGLAFAYSAATWCWCFAVIGAAVRFMSHAHPAVRYAADASYWIYITHLPVVAALQVAVGRLNWHWSLKFALIMTVTLTVLFASYRYMVRGTFIGQMLNGRRYPRRVQALAADESLASRSAPRAAARSDAPAIATGLAPTAPEAPAMLATLSGVHKRYGKTVALAGLDLAVRSGELLALLGPNGAGKSTAISLWLGLLEPDQGSVQLLDGSPLDVETRRQVGVMMQDVGLTPELRVRELVELTASYYPAPLTTEEALRLTHTEALAHRLYATLSAGQKRQVQFALAICGRPRLLFLDEPSVGLDLEARETMWRTIRSLIAQGRSIVLTTHYLEEAEMLADRVAVLSAGRLIASGTVAEIRSVVSRKQITCTTALAADDVRSWPDVVAVGGQSGRLQITVIDGERVLRQLLAADESVRDVEIRHAGLAEAFVELTKEAA